MEDGTSQGVFSVWKILNGDPEDILMQSRTLVHARLNSFWLCADVVTIPGTLAYFVQQIFHFHVDRLGLRVNPSSGVEFWVQCLDDKTTSGSSEGAARARPLHSVDEIPWHFDKDEVEMSETKQMKHPTVATVTYLSGAGGRPTVVFGETSTLVVEPRVFQHLAFPGDHLHGVPSGRLSNNRSTECDTLVSSERRTTLLINIWQTAPKRSNVHCCSPPKKYHEVSETKVLRRKNQT